MRSSIEKQSSRNSIRLAAAVAATLGVSATAWAAVTDVKGGPIESVTVVRGTDTTSTTSTTYVDIPGATTTIKVKDDDTLVLVRFSAESYCQGPTPGGWCSVRIVAVKGGAETELRPDVGLDYAFNSVDVGGNSYWEAASMDRSIVLGVKGKYTIKAQYANNVAGISNNIDDWSLTVETAPAK